MTYTCEVRGYDSGLNELLNAQRQIYNPRTKKVKVFNPEKAKNDRLCEKAIRSCPNLRGVKITEPVIIRYNFYVANKKRDRSNYASGFV